MKDSEKMLDYLSPNERKIIPLLKEKNINEICKRAQLDKVSVLRALDFLENKHLVKISNQNTRIVELGVNGAL